MKRIENETTPKMKRSAVMERADGTFVRRMVVCLPLETARKLKIRCADGDADISATIATAVDKFLAGGMA